MNYRSCQGFTILEMVIAIAIVLVVGMSAVPALRQMRNSIERGEALDQVEFDIRRIRTEAVATGLLSVFKVNAGGQSYTAGFDLLPYASPPAIEESAFAGFLPNSVTVSSPIPVYFDSRGFLVNELGDPTTSEVVLTSNGNIYAHIYITPTGALNVYNNE